MYIERAGFSTLFEKLDTSSIQNYKNSLNNSVCWNEQNSQYFLKNCVRRICEVLSILQKMVYLERAKL